MGKCIIAQYQQLETILVRIVCIIVLLFCCCLPAFSQTGQSSTNSHFGNLHRQISLPDSTRIAISDSNFTGMVLFTRLHAVRGYQVALLDRENHLLDRIMLRRQIYRVDFGDINGDGKTDFCVGVIKKTHFDRVTAKRLFVYKIVQNKINKLWLGTRTRHRLVDFSVTRLSGKPAIVHTIEKSSKYFYTGVYRWASFGLVFIRYTQEHIHLSSAYREIQRELSEAAN